MHWPPEQTGVEPEQFPSTTHAAQLPEVRLQWGVEAEIAEHCVSAEQGAQTPPEQTGVEPVQVVSPPQPVRVALQACDTVELKHRCALASQVAAIQVAPDTPLAAQTGVAVGQSELPMAVNAPLSQVLRVKFPAHCETVGPQPLPSERQE